MDELTSKGKSPFWAQFGNHLRREGFFRLTSVHSSIVSKSSDTHTVAWDMVSQRVIPSSQLVTVQKTNYGLSHSWIRIKDLKVLQKCAPERYRRCVIFKPGTYIFALESNPCHFFNSERLLFPFAVESLLAILRKIRIAHTHAISLREKLALYNASDSLASRSSPFWVSTSILRAMPEYNALRCHRERPVQVRMSASGRICKFFYVGQLVYSCFLTACINMGPMLNLATGHPFSFRARMKLYETYVSRGFTSSLWLERRWLQSVKAFDINLLPHSRGVYIPSLRRVFFNACQMHNSEKLMKVYVEMRRRLSLYRNAVHQRVFSWRNAQAFHSFCLQWNYTSALWVSHGQLGEVRLRENASGLWLSGRHGRRKRVYSVMQLEGYPDSLKRLRDLRNKPRIRKRKNQIEDILENISTEEENANIAQVLQLK